MLLEILPLICFFVFCCLLVVATSKCLTNHSEVYTSEMLFWSRTLARIAFGFLISIISIAILLAIISKRETHFWYFTITACIPGLTSLLVSFLLKKNCYRVAQLVQLFLVITSLVFTLIIGYLIFFSFVMETADHPGKSAARLIEMGRTP